MTKPLSAAMRAAILDPVIERVYELVREAHESELCSAMPVKPYGPQPHAAIGFIPRLSTTVPGQKPTGMMVVELYKNERSIWWAAAVLRAGPFREAKCMIELTHRRLQDPGESIEQLAKTIAAHLLAAVVHPTPARVA